MYRVYGNPETNPVAIPAFIRDAEDFERLSRIVEEGKYDINLSWRYMIRPKTLYWTQPKTWVRKSSFFIN